MSDEKFMGLFAASTIAACMVFLGLTIMCSGY
jgi:hypothetical protein